MRDRLALVLACLRPDHVALVVKPIKNKTQQCQAVFTEKGASASQMTAAKILDTLSRLLGMAGEASACTTQVKVKDAPRLHKLLDTESPTIWTRLPRNRGQDR